MGQGGHFPPNIWTRGTLSRMSPNIWGVPIVINRDFSWHSDICLYYIYVKCFQNCWLPFYAILSVRMVRYCMCHYGENKEYFWTDIGYWFHNIFFHLNANFTLLLTKRLQLLGDKVPQTLYPDLLPLLCPWTLLGRPLLCPPNREDRSMPMSASSIYYYHYHGLCFYFFVLTYFALQFTTILIAFHDFFKYIS